MTALLSLIFKTFAVLLLLACLILPGSGAHSAETQQGTIRHAD